MKNGKKPIIFASFVDMLNLLPDEKSCREYLEKLYWDDKPRCPYCKCEKVYELKVNGTFKGLRKCSSCRKRFTVTVGTMFESSHVPLRKWFIAIFLLNTHKKGISSYQLANDLGITQKSAWFMLGRIRNAFKPEKSKRKASGEFQVDESFIGGKNKNRHIGKKIFQSQGRSVKDKTPVFGLLETGGKVYTQVVNNTSAKTLKPIIEKLVAEGSIIVSDEWGAYRGLSAKYTHIVVKHNIGQYSKDGFSNNGIENFWSHLKRGITGVYHKTSRKHLQRYCDEFAYRFNNRRLSNKDKFDLSIKSSKRMTYKELVKK
jgi:transposase-like protein